MNNMFKWNDTIQEMQDTNKPKYKSFREQYTECAKNGNRILVDTLPMKSFFGYDVGVILVCVKNKCICSSKVCNTG